MNKFVIDGKCYNPFHYADDFETCSCGLKLGDDTSVKMSVWEQVLRETRIAEIGIVSYDTRDEYGKDS